MIATQDVHKSYGGVVPELASREHQKNIVPVVSEALKNASLEAKDLDAIAYTQGPGLLGALLVGNAFAKSFALALDIPTIPVHHMKAHVLAHFIENPKPKFPFLCLTVSGGHTQIVKVSSYINMEIVGQTKDDAVGEAFDKCAKMLDLPYPGGPLIDKYAQNGDPDAYEFSKYEMDQLNYSFSGIKTSVLYFLRDQIKKNPAFIKENMNDLCASIQKHLIDMLMVKLIKAAKQFKIDDIAIAGGVAANSGLRSALEFGKSKYGWNTFIPDFQYCTDNAGMIAMAGYLQYSGNQIGMLTDSPKPRMPFN